MKCQEIMELMQRDLDQDLGHNEQLSMLAHLRYCPDCAAMYEKLKRLSMELENLPMVIPSVNIVDSILPRLEQMNYAHIEQSAAQAVVAPLTELNQRKVDLKKESKDYFSWKWVSGAMAAAVLLGAFVFNHNNKPMHNNADVMMDPQQNNEAKFSNSMKEDQASSGQMAGAASSAKDEEAKAKGITGNPAVPNTNLPPAPLSSDNTSKQQNDNSANLEKRSVNSEAPSSNPALKEQADNKTEPKSAAPIIQAPRQLAPIVREAVPQPTPMLSPSAPLRSEPIDTGKTAQQQTPAVSETPPLMPSPASVEGNPKPTPAFAEGNSAPMLFSAAAPIKSLNSANGEYLAVVEQQRVMIKDKDNQLVYKSAYQWKPDDAVLLKNWLSMDSVTYEVKAKDESVQTYIISLSQKTEIKQ